MDPGYYEKQSWELLRCTIDASNTVASGDTISTLTVTVFDDDDTDVTTTIISGTPSFSGTDLTVIIQAGTDGEMYNVRIRLVTTAGEQLEDDLELHIKEKG